MGNETLNNASKAKNDEFYTQISDITKECTHYKGQFKGKTIFCNCDDPYESEFFKYFALNFNHLELKKLIASCYIGSPIANTQLSLFDYESAESKTTKSPHKIEITEMADENAGDMRGLPLVEYLLRNRKNALTRLQGDGDFRSPECIEILKEADIVVTNPPFSLFREYVAQLMEYEKRFLIIGNKNAITYKEIFKLIKEDKIWIGRMPMGTDMLFNVPEKYSKTFLEKKKEGSAYKIVNGVVKGRSPTCWFTNLDHKKRHEKFYFYKKYSPEEFPHYDNYDAIEVSKVVEIPEDWDGVMGVPISFLDKYNPEYFEIIGSNRGVDQDPNGVYGRGSMLNGKETFKRLFIRNKKGRNNK
jgi:hypothetical protein